MKNYGCWKDKSLSEHLKCIVKQGKTSVTGKLPEGYAVSLSHNWISPFTEDSPGSVYPKSETTLQSKRGMTMKTRINSTLTWENSEPQSLSLPLSFSAFSDPENEVDMAVRTLMAMSSPDFSGKLKIFNRIPKRVQVSIGRKFILGNCVIDSVEVSDPMIKTRDGFSLKMSLTLNLRTRYTQDRVDILKKNYR